MFKLAQPKNSNRKLLPYIYIFTLVLNLYGIESNSLYHEMSAAAKIRVQVSLNVFENKFIWLTRVIENRLNFLRPQ